MKNLRAILALLAIAIAAISTAATKSDDGAWTAVEPAAVKAAAAAGNWVTPEKYATFTVDGPIVQSGVFSAPKEVSVDPKVSETIITVPKPDGSFERFRIVDVVTMEPGLAAIMSDMRTFAGVGIDDPSATIRGDYGPLGFHASVFNGSEGYYVDPLYRKNYNVYASYYLKDNGATEKEQFTCLVKDTEQAVKGQAANKILSHGTTFRTYRLAMGITGEYAVNLGAATAAEAQASVVSTVNRINHIYETEVAVRLILIAGNIDFMYLDPATDPFTTTSASILIDENNDNMQAILADGDYDIGHLLNSTGGGIADLGSVCDNGVKARGTSGMRSQPADNDTIYHISHEIGHQFNAQHNFNGNGNDNCADNREGTAAYEPASGTTLMCYPGTCGSENIRVGKEHYFHRDALNRIIDFVNGTGCDVESATGNNPPTVNAGPDIVVPINTPFKLKGVGTDIDGDPITYTWEQYDLGPARAIDVTDDGIGPVFRSIKPSSNPARYFPTNAVTPALCDTFFSVPNTLRNFRVTVRDHRFAGGGTNDDAMTVSVVDAPVAPFRVTVGNTPGERWSGSTQLITWDVAETDLAPYSIHNVNIMMSTDSGATYAFTLATNTPNDGTELINMPNVTSNAVRIRVEPVASGVYDVSDANIVVGAKVDVNPIVNDFGIACPGDVVDREFTIHNNGNGDLVIAEITKSGSSAFSLIPNDTDPEPSLPLTIIPGSSATYTVRFTPTATPGAVNATYTLNTNDPLNASVGVSMVATVGEPTISVTATENDLGLTCPGDVIDRVFTINNTGNCDLVISSIDKSGASEFSLIPSDASPSPALPLTIVAGSSAAYTVRFTAPVTAGAYSATYTLNSNDTTNPSVDVNLDATVGAPNISVTPCPIAFGTVCAEDTEGRTKTITVCNNGLCPLNVTNIAIAGTQFTLEGVPALPLDLAAGSCFTFDVKFTPDSVGPKSSTLEVTSNDPDTPVTSCNLTGETVENTISVPEKIAFDPTVIASIGNCGTNQLLAILNNGTCNVDITNVTITGVNSDSFSFVNLPSLVPPATVAPGAQLGEGLAVRFHPAALIAARFHQAQVNVTYIRDPFSGDTETVSIPLMGEAVKTGFRLLVRAGGQPVNNVLAIIIRSNNGKQVRQGRVNNANLRTVNAPDPFFNELSFKYHFELGGLTYPNQGITGNYEVYVALKQAGKVVIKSTKFQSLATCNFNQDVVVDF